MGNRSVRRYRIIGTLVILIGIGLLLSPLEGQQAHLIFGALIGYGIATWILSFIL